MLHRRLGRRGAVLLILGLLWILQGIGVYLAPYNANVGSELLVHEQLPVWLRVSVWCGTGVVAVAYALRRACADTPGFLALVFMPVERAASYGWGFLMYLVPGVPDGYPRGLVSATVWAGVAALVIIVAGWREPTPTIAQVLTAETEHDEHGGVV